MEERERKVYREYVYLMENIKELELKTPSGQPLTYRVNTNLIAKGVPMAEDERLMLQKLEEHGAINIIKSYGNDSPI